MPKPVSELSDEAIRSVVDPVHRAQLLRSIARDRGNLTPSQSRMYRSAIAQLAAGKRTQQWIGMQVGLSRGRISVLLASARSSESTAQMGATP